MLWKVVPACYFFISVMPVYFFSVTGIVDVCLLMCRLRCSDGQLPQSAPALCRWCGELLFGSQRSQYLVPHQRAAGSGHVRELQHRQPLLPCRQLLCWSQVSAYCIIWLKGYITHIGVITNILQCNKAKKKHDGITCRTAIRVKKNILQLSKHLRLHVMIHPLCILL